jgi:hypothetical protein
MIVRSDPTLNDTFAFERGTPPTFPPQALLRQYAKPLADLLDEHSRAVAARAEAVAAFRATLPGGRRFADVLAADRTAVVDHLMRHGSLPDPAQSPIVRLLTIDVAVSYTRAQHAAFIADAVAAQVPAWIRANGKPIIKALGQELDSLCLAIAQLLLTARDGKDLHPYLSAQKSLPQWRERRALHSWLQAPDQAFRVRPGTQPGELALLAHEAHEATHDQPQAVVPDYSDAVARFEKEHPEFRNRTYEAPRRPRVTIGT